MELRAGGVIPVVVGNHQLVDGREIHPQFSHIRKQGARGSSCVEQHSLFRALDQTRKAPIDGRALGVAIIVVENRERDRVWKLNAIELRDSPTRRNDTISARPSATVLVSSGSQ